MGYEEYKNSLNQKYTEFYCNNGQCKYYNQCSKDMNTCNPITFCKVKLGRNYGQNNNPKIMFIGKEGVSNSTDIEEPSKVSDVNINNYHYFGTIYTAALLLNGKILTDSNDKASINKNTLSQYDDLRNDFCLTNYFKCAFRNENNNRGGIKTNSVMSKKCKEILLEEIKILRPDVIIVQGKFYHSSFYNTKGLLKFCSVDNSSPLYKAENCNIEVDKYNYNDSKKDLYIVWGYHPCAYGYKWFNTLDDYKKALSSIPTTKYYGKV